MNSNNKTKMETSAHEEYIQELIDDIQYREEQHVIEPENAKILIQLIRQNKNDERIAGAIASLGTKYNKTGLVYDVRLEKMGSDIKYLKRNSKLSFDQGGLHHKLIIGDNYDALRQLLITHRGKVDVIYIDPPYGCNDMGDYAKTNYENHITRDNLLSSLSYRLRLARQLMSDEGVIFVSIDDKNQAYIKCLMDEIFYEKNYEGSIHWRRRHNQPNDKTKLIGIVAENILCYSKDREKHKVFGVGKVPVTGKFSNPDNDPRGEWATKPWKAGKGQSGTIYEITSPSGKKMTEEWLGSYETYKELSDDNRIIFPKKGDGFPRKKYFKFERDEEGQCATNWWSNKEFGCNQDAARELESIFDGNRVFDNPKPVSLIEALINLGSVKQNAVVLDFYAGSGTTGQAVLELNRNSGGNRTFILCTNNDTTDTENGIGYDVTSKRLKRIMTGKCYDGSDAFQWIKENQAYSDSLDVYDICSVSNMNVETGKTAFDVIDERNYDIQSFKDTMEKVNWVCNNFENTQKFIVEKE